MPDFLIYGATGYTGSLISHEAVRRGYRPILAERRGTGGVSQESWDWTSVSSSWMTSLTVA